MSLYPTPQFSGNDLNLFDFSEAVATSNHAEAYSPSLANVTPPAVEVIEPVSPPKAAAQGFQERWYQTNALVDIERRLPIHGIRVSSKGELLQCPTGGGKTRIASLDIDRRLKADKRVLVLVDLEMLLNQMRDDLAEQGIYPLIEKAQHSALSQFGRYGNCVLASAQSFYTARLQRWARNSFDYIVIDEAHDMERFLPIIEHFSNAQVLGLTATPRDESKKFFNYPFIKTLTMREAIEGWNGNTQEHEAPFLSRIAVLPIDASHIDLSNIRTVKKDFAQGELDRRIFEQVNWLASAIMEATQGRRPWIFCPQTVTSYALAKALRDLGGTYASYHSKVDNPARILKRFVRDELQGLTTVNMLIKGVNVPKVDCIIRVRPSLNIVQATQEIGRGTRLFPGKKNCLVVEFAFDTKGRRLAGVLDAIMDGTIVKDKRTNDEVEKEEKIREKAEKIIKEG
ncbi:DEAD/DEAH box helicase, partial [bacterium]